MNDKLMQYIISCYKRATSRAILLDFDGTLVGFNIDPLAVKPPASTIAILKKLAEDPANTVAIISGRGHHTLQEWLGGLPVIMYAEHGLLRRDAGKKWHTLVSNSAPWRSPIHSLFSKAVALAPGSFIEEKTASIVWQYRGSEQAIGEELRQHLLAQLQLLAKQYSFAVLDGNKVIEAKPAGIDKGTAVTEILAAQQSQPDFILCAGDDVTDEAMFAAAPAHSFTVKVGEGQTQARERVASVEQFIALLDNLTS